MSVWNTTGLEMSDSRLKNDKWRSKFSEKNPSLYKGTIFEVKKVPPTEPNTGYYEGSPGNIPFKTEKCCRPEM